MPVIFPRGIPVIKRLFDLTASFLGILFLSPLLFLLAIAVRIKHGSPVLFRQRRPGYKGTPFLIYKFRTMSDARAVDGSLLPDASRITSLGRFLRASSMDELPELVNVLRGEMSLVGPRPLLMQYLDLYSREQMRRHDVLPGVTGWAQVNGRNAISWDDKFRLDVWYVDHWSFWLDIRILFATLQKTLMREGISQPGYSTADEFRGNEKP